MSFQEFANLDENIEEIINELKKKFPKGPNFVKRGVQTIADGFTVPFDEWAKPKNEVMRPPRKKVVVDGKKKPVASKNLNESKQRTLDEANKILQSLFATRQNQMTFSVPPISEVLIKKRTKGKEVAKLATTLKSIDLNEGSSGSGGTSSTSSQPFIVKLKIPPRIHTIVEKSSTKERKSNSSTNYITVETQTDFSRAERAEIGTQTMNESTEKSSTNNDFELQAYHVLYEHRMRQATNYKHRSEKTSSEKKLDRISDYLEAFLLYSDSCHNQYEAYKNGHHYDTFLNPEKFFTVVYSWIKGEDKKLMGALKYLHSIIIKLYFMIEHERSIQKLKESYTTYLDKLKQNPTEGTEARTAYNSIKLCAEKITEAFLLCETAKELLGDRSLDISTNSLENVRIFAREHVDKWRTDKGINFVAL
ncbi:8574_t:CDS:2 [Diversispora eburnea]|uniref:8574_t:CDS:1 n=1 Tax=Diversispora eburnea TaxID=1213867 RepID=A0A9N8UYA8_9GLOM|nr:8574_t:CDS:2 [Diversispora eburnea]